MWGATKNNTRETGKNSNIKGHTNFLGVWKNRRGKAFRGPVTEGCLEIFSKHAGILCVNRKI